MPHDEEEHPEVQSAEARTVRRSTKKRRRRVRISGKSVFLLQTLLRRGLKSRASVRRRTRRP